jgi:hypothetical protein
LPFKHRLRIEVCLQQLQIFFKAFVLIAKLGNMLRPFISDTERLLNRCRILVDAASVSDNAENRADSSAAFAKCGPCQCCPRGRIRCLVVCLNEKVERLSG